MIIKKYLNWLNSLFQNLTGSADQFTLENRVFNSFSVMAIFATFCYLFVNLALNLYIPTLICVVVITLHSIVFVLSRYDQKFKIAIVLTGIECNAFVVLNYFYNAGISGPTIILFFTTVFLMVCISPNRYMFYWVLINNLLLFLLFLLEFNYPSIIQSTYSNNTEKYIDNYLTYFINCLLVCFGIYYIRQAYQNKEKEIVNQKNSLDVLSQQKSKMFSIISHDFRSPLASIEQYLSTLVNIDLSDSERKMIKAQLLRTTQDTQEMLLNLLEWSKSQMDGKMVNLEKIDIEKVLRNTFKITKAAAEFKNITFNHYITPNLQLMADKTMIELVVRNLLNNAVKFTPMNGEVYFEARQMEDEISIIVKDNGQGISPEDQEKIFGLNMSSKRGTNNESGIGIGLHLCKEYTQLQGGKIFFESELNKGTTFYLSFPTI